MADKYTIPSQARIGHVHLKVSNLEQALKFYCNILGFTLVTTHGKDSAFVSAGGYHHHIGLNTWYSKGASSSPTHSTGLYHLAILYPTRKDLAVAYKQLLDVKYPVNGAADHGVSEAIYLNDPDHNGLELYWDKPIEQWPHKTDGSVEMVTMPLDLNNLLKELEA